VDRGSAALLTAAVGCLIALQAPINAGLAKAIGPRQSAFVSFLIGTVLLLFVAAFARGGLGQIRDVGSIPAWYYLTGGLLGAAYVSTVLVTVKTLGAGPVTAATVAGQLSASLVVDQFGLLGVTRSPISALKLVGVLLLAAGTYLIVRE
jgi:bacterial/archaeal transporter family-2 protein